MCHPSCSETAVAEGNTSGGEGGGGELQRPERRPLRAFCVPAGISGSHAAPLQALQHHWLLHHGHVAGDQLLLVLVRPSQGMSAMRRAWAAPIWRSCVPPPTKSPARPSATAGLVKGSTLQALQFGVQTLHSIRHPRQCPLPPPCCAATMWLCAGATHRCAPLAAAPGSRQGGVAAAAAWPQPARRPRRRRRRQPPPGLCRAAAASSDEDEGPGEHWL